MQALVGSAASTKVQLGKQLTQGLGAGANPDVGREAALEDTNNLREQLSGADMVFVTAGMGGGTGTGGAPVIARVAKELGALTVAVVTKPFHFEGKRRMRQADEGIQELKSAVDTLITIPNQRLLAVAGRDSSLLDTFKRADEILLHAVKGISDLITVHGLINLDFADVRTIMAEMGMAMMGAGNASGDNRAVEAAQRAISSPLLDDISIRGAKGVLINITGGLDLALHEVDQAASLIQQEADDDANIIFGAVIDESMENEVRITVIATGFGEAAEVQMRPSAPATKPVAREAESAPRQDRPSFSWLRERDPSSAAEIRPGLMRNIPRDRDNPRPVVRLGTIEDGAEPSWHRSSLDEGAATHTDDRAFTMSDEAEDEYEIPAFLRKTAG
jgi:cell division protein FtsZ